MRITDSLTVWETDVLRITDGWRTTDSLRITNCLRITDGLRIADNLRITDCLIVWYLTVWQSGSLTFWCSDNNWLSDGLISEIPISECLTNWWSETLWEFLISVFFTLSDFLRSFQIFSDFFRPSELLSSCWCITMPSFCWGSYPFLKVPCLLSIDNLAHVPM